MQDHAHRDDVGARERIAKEVARDGGHALREAAARDRGLCDRLHDRKVEREAPQLRMPGGDRTRQVAGRAAHVAERAVRREIEPLRDRHEVRTGDAAHRADELLDTRGIAIELLEHRGATALELVLWLAGAETVFEIAPETEEPVVVHLSSPPT